MGPLSYMRSVVDRNVVMRHKTVYVSRTLNSDWLLGLVNIPCFNWGLDVGGKGNYLLHLLGFETL